VISLIYQPNEGWLYVSIVKDLCTKQVVGYACSERIDSNLVMDALRMAVRREKPPEGLIFHSGRGIQYCSTAYRQLMERFHITPSMSRKGDPYDNAVAENFFSCLKCEMVYLHNFTTRALARSYVFWYIEAFYNSIRPHGALGYLSPLAFKRQLLRGAPAA